MVLFPRVEIQGRTITGKLTDNSEFTTFSPGNDPGLMGDLLTNGVTCTSETSRRDQVY